MPRTTDRPEPTCSIERSLAVLGEKWTLLVIREAFRGSTRFSEFRDSLGIASDILTTRLATLVDHGVLERRPYRDTGSRERSSYHLTPRGRDLRLVLAALTQWGDHHRPSERGPATIYRRAGTGELVSVAFVDADGEMLADADVEATPGPGYTWHQPPAAP